MERQDDCPAASYLAEAAPGRRPVDALLQAPIAWDAWADVRRDAKAAEPLAPLALQRAACVEKWVDPAPDDQELDDLRLQWELQAARWEQRDERVPYRPDAARFAEQSSEAPEFAEQQDEQEQVAPDSLAAQHLHSAEVLPELAWVPARRDAEQASR